MMGRVTTWGLVLEPLQASLGGNYMDRYDINKVLIITLVLCSIYFHIYFLTFKSDLSRAFTGLVGH
jgi:hypothetical protein